MSVFDELCTLFSSGRFPDAEKLALKLLEANPSDEYARYALAQSVSRQGRTMEAIGFMESLLELNPMQAAFHHDYGAMLASIGRLPEAEAAYRMATVLDPKMKDARFNLADMLFRQARLEEALRITDALLSDFPDFPEAYVLKGELLRHLERPEEAVSAFNAALTHGLEDPTALTNVGIALNEMGKRNEAFLAMVKAGKANFDDAASCFLFADLMKAQNKRDVAYEYYRRAIGLNPDFTDAYNNLGLMLLEDDAPDEAGQMFSHAIKIDPAFFPALNNLGNCFLKNNNLEAARHYYQKALIHAQNPNDVLSILADVCHRLHDLEEAKTYYQQMLSLSPGSPEALFKLGTLQLLRGHFEEGWPLYEARWQVPGIKEKRRQFVQPAWQGESLAGKSLLVYTEQGFGDNIQFVRYFALLREHYPSATLYFWCRNALIRLFAPYASNYGITLLPEFIPEGLPVFDFQVALMTLPTVFGTTVSTIPAQKPPLSVPQALRDHWGEKINRLTDNVDYKKIGIVWAGSKELLYDKLRSVPSEKLAPLFAIDGITWISLQKDHGANEIGQMAPGRRMIDVVNAAEDFADTAAIIDHLDLVISVDTAVAHLAGAMNKPVWLLNRFDTDWRWQLNRSDSPWYPSMTIFRQQALGNWDDVIIQITSSLRHFLNDLSR